MMIMMRRRRNRSRRSSSSSKRSIICYMPTTSRRRMRRRRSIYYMPTVPRLPTPTAANARTYDQLPVMGQEQQSCKAVPRTFLGGACQYKGASL